MFLLQSVQRSYGAHVTFCDVGTRAFLPGGKVAGA